MGVTSTIDTQFVYLVKSLVDNVVSGIHVGQNHSVVVTSENEIYVFGNNECGQLGLGHKDNVGVPERLVIRNEYSSQEKIVFVSCGAMHSSFLAGSL
uniref:Uncharacterized protein n=1 Tax=Arcella intermedia TaxID=1963864 RepID=A0A6B2LTC8_9EUKA